MNGQDWTQEEQRELVEWAAAGFSGKQIAQRLGRSRNAVLGRAQRTGVKLSMTEAKRHLLRTRTKAPPCAKGVKFPPGHAIFRPRQRGKRAFTDAEIAVAIARRLAGMSGNKAARSIGASWQSLRKWEKDPSLRAQGLALFEIAHHDAAQRATERHEAQVAADLAERKRVFDHNRPILAAMPARDRLVCGRRIAGHTLQEIATDLGLTRERIRQIEAKWRVRSGLIVPSAEPIGEATIRLFALKPKEPQKAKPKRGDIWQLAHRLANGEPLKRPYRMSDAERQRRAEWARGLAERRRSGLATPVGGAPA